MVKVFVPLETLTGETRVAITPEAVKALAKAGLPASVQAGAGFASGYTDDEYREAGATISTTDDRASADLILQVAPPSPEEATSFKAGAMIVSGLQPTLQLPAVKALRDAKITSFGMESVPRITRAQKMDVLSSQATAAGYQAVLLAAAKLQKFFPLLMTAAGTIKPAKVFILGAGVAGLQAIATAKRLGAVVEANDVRAAAAEQVESLGAKFVSTGTPPEAETSGGYAKESTKEYLDEQRRILTEHIAGADVVITTALIPGRKAPLIVTKEMVAGMHPGSVIVDLAAPTGGNVEGTIPGETACVEGVHIIGETNLPGLKAADASRMWARNVVAFLLPIIKEGKLEIDWEDEVYSTSVVTRDGEIKHARAAEAISEQGAS